MSGKLTVALGVLVTVFVVGCDLVSAPTSPTPFPTLIPLATASPSAAAATLAPVPTTAPSQQASASPAPLPLPAQFTKIPKAGNGYVYTPQSKPASLAQGSPKNIRLGQCGLRSPIDVDGSVWDPMYGDDGEGGPLTEAQLTDLSTPSRVTITLVDQDTLQLVTRHAATIALVRHAGTRRYPSCP